MNPLHLLSVALGGAFGAVSRFVIAHALGQRLAMGIPWGTLVANVVGCFLLGALYEAGRWAPLNPNVRGLLSVGFVGALTTFSTFTLETINLMRGGKWALVTANVAASLVLGFAACVAGLWTVRVVLRGVAG
jgi:CrcB protein